MRVPPRSVAKNVWSLSPVDSGLVQQAADSAKTHRPERTSWGGRGRQECRVGPAAAIVRNVVERSLIGADREVLARRVDAGMWVGASLKWAVAESSEAATVVARPTSTTAFAMAREAKPGAVTSTM